MKGDFTRFTHDPKKHYSRVLKQQGRVDLDADWNENEEIQQYLEETSNKDIVGYCGVPMHEDGFRISYIDNLFDVHFVNKTEGWAVGSRATILHTENGGETWECQQATDGIEALADNIDLYGLHFVGSGKGWAVGDKGTIIHMDGQGWKRQSSGTDVLLRDVFFINDTFGWAVGKNTILFTDDGGNNWDPQLQIRPEGPDLFLSGVFMNDIDGWAVGYRQSNIPLVKKSPIIFKTSNGGRKWEEQELYPTIGNNIIRSIFFISEDLGWGVGEKGTIIKWNGEEWAIQEVDENGFDEDLYCVHFSNKSFGWAVGKKGTIIKWNGEEWQKEESPSSADLLGVFSSVFSDFPLDINCWAVGQNGTILTMEKRKKWLNRSPLFTISSGRIYVDGILGQLDHPASYMNQPDFPSPPPLSAPTGDRTDLVFLDLWQRHITAIEDPEIREVALGGPDTTTRLKTIVQVKILENVETGNCEDDLQHGWPPIPPLNKRGRLSTQAEPGAIDEPCIIAPGGGYRGLENRLYRVEIHEGGVLSSGTNENVPTFKWSRDNGSVVVGGECIDESGSGNKVKVNRLGRDQVLVLKEGDWVEVLGDGTELRGEPGTMARIEPNGISEQEAQMFALTLDQNISQHSGEKHLKVRRWDGVNQVNVHQWIELEDGIQIRFWPGTYCPGDYWIFTARAATGNVKTLDKALPKGIEHHYCKLALVIWKDGNIESVLDCRRVFLPLTEQLRFFYVGGAGQEGLPGSQLAQPLQVGVANGMWPLAGARVKFEVVTGGGSPSDEIVRTSSDGIAEVQWTLGDSDSQRVKAILLDQMKTTPIYFNADFKEEGRKHTGCSITVGPGGDYETLAGSLAKFGEVDELCICLLPGNHYVNEEIDLDGIGKHLHISGCGKSTRIISNRPIKLSTLASFTLSGLDFDWGELQNCFMLYECEDVAMRFCKFKCNLKDDENYLIYILSADRVVIENCVLESISNINGNLCTALCLEKVGDTTITDCQIIGVMSLYGEYSSDMVEGPNGIWNKMTDLNKKLQENTINDNSKSTLWMRSNRITTMRLGGNIIDSLLDFGEDELNLDSIFRHIFLTDNVIEQGMNLWLGHEVRLTENKLGVSQIDNVGVVTGSVVADTSIYVGNSTETKGSLFYNLNYGSKLTESLANINIRFVT
jgi:photosystem II stability/assembly factor-like uncharacterized protein